jgi:hypothetical protein
MLSSDNSGASGANMLIVKPETFDSAWVRRFALNFERKISKNAELRAKFESDPQKYVNRNYWLYRSLIQP